MDAKLAVDRAMFADWVERLERCHITAKVAAEMRALLETKPPKPAAWLHTMHMEFNQKNKVADFTRKNPFGKPGRDYSADYPVTTEPLYLHPAPET